HSHDLLWARDLSGWLAESSQIQAPAMHTSNERPMVFPEGITWTRPALQLACAKATVDLDRMQGECSQVRGRVAATAIEIGHLRVKEQRTRAWQVQARLSFVERRLFEVQADGVHLHPRVVQRAVRQLDAPSLHAADRMVGSDTAVRLQIESIDLRTSTSSEVVLRNVRLQFGNGTELRAETVIGRLGARHWTCHQIVVRGKRSERRFHRMQLDIGELTLSHQAAGAGLLRWPRAPEFRLADLEAQP
ncbi:MAG: hypothetical protein V3T05_07490, partial [Myxococcota bacterium]